MWSTCECNVWKPNESENDTNMLFLLRQPWLNITGKQATCLPASCHLPQLAFFNSPNYPCRA